MNNNRVKIISRGRVFNKKLQKQISSQTSGRSVKVPIGTMKRAQLKNKFLSFIQLIIYSAYSTLLTRTPPKSSYELRPLLTTHYLLNIEINFTRRKFKTEIEHVSQSQRLTKLIREFKRLRRRSRGKRRLKMILYFTYESRDTLNSFNLFIFVKSFRDETESGTQR